jgi:predicted ATPase/DNA-binding winged helix-turn-helix (wHTH) protein
MIEAAEKTFSFGEFELSGTKRTLLKRGENVSLNSKTFDLLLTLIENRGQILSKDELLETVWEGQFVEENNLSVQISALRKIFGETKDEHKFIVTIPGKGYKFIAGETSLTTTDQSSKPVTKKFDEGVTIIGRAKEIAEIKSNLCESDKCLLTLTGAGGSGKTRLAQTIADEMRTEFADGVFFVELAAVRSAESVAGAIAKVLDVKESGEKSVFDSLKDFLQQRSVLLILDNFEQLLSAAHLLKELLDSAANLKILVTSRAPLHLKCEREKVVQPLAIPPPNTNLSTEQISSFSSVELFAVRAQEARANFVLNEGNAPVIAEICQRLDGLPLAIELAAARVKLLSPQAILKRLENSLKLLTGGANDLPVRQRTMRGTIQWSYDLLNEDEQKLFRRLAVFAGGFTVEAAEFLSEPPAVAGGLSIGKDDSLLNDNPPATARGSDSVLDLLFSLTDNNLLVSKELSDGAVRLRMLEIVREFALEILQETDEFEKLQRIHSHYFLSFAEEAEPFLQSENSVEWFDKLEIELENIRAALVWSLKNDGETAARIAAAIRYFWLNHSHFSEGLSWGQVALQVTENTISEARFKLLLSNGVFLKKMGKFEPARKICEKALTESRETNNLSQMIKACHGLAAIAVLQKDYVSAKNYTEEVLAINRELNDEILTANTLCSLGDLEISIGNYSSARPLFEESLLLSKKLGGKRLLSIVHFNLGTIDYFNNEAEAASFNFAESLRIAQEMGNKLLISCAFDGFAALAAGNGNHLQSAKLAGAADFLRETIGYTVEPAEEIFREKYLTTARAALNPQDFTVAYETGRSLNFNESIALTKVRTFDFSDVSDENTSNIIIETHQISRIVIEEEIEDVSNE